MDSKTLALLCRDLADNRKAEDITVLDVREVSSVTDYFVVATGTSEPHLRAIVGEIADTLKVEHGMAPSGTEGSVTSPWVVLDYFDVIVHVMRKDVRDMYRLEELWGDAPRVKVKKEKKPAAPKVHAAASAEPKTRKPAAKAKAVKAPAAKAPAVRKKKPAAK